jgi:hypothetical protein
LDDTACAIVAWPGFPAAIPAIRVCVQTAVPAVNKVAMANPANADLSLFIAAS